MKHLTLDRHQYSSIIIFEGEVREIFTGEVTSELSLRDERRSTGRSLNSMDEGMDTWKYGLFRGEQAAWRF